MILLDKMEGLSPGPQPEKELKREAKGKVRTLFHL
jgi:hypothetical protein